MGDRQCESLRRALVINEKHPAWGKPKTSAILETLGSACASMGVTDADANSDGGSSATELCLEEELERRDSKDNQSPLGTFEVAKQSRSQLHQDENDVVEHDAPTFPPCCMLRPSNIFPKATSGVEDASIPI